MAQPRAFDEHAAAAARRLRRLIFEQLGWEQLGWGVPLVVAAAGCSPVQPTGEDGGVTTDPSGANDSQSSEVSSSNTEVGEAETGMMEAGTIDEGDDPPPQKFDILAADAPLLPSCESYWLTADEAAALYPDCSLGPFDPNAFVEFYELCVEAPPNGDCSSICPPGQLCEGMESCVWADLYELCGPFEVDGSCCMVVAGEPLPPIGRPFIVDGVARLAAAAVLGSPSNTGARPQQLGAAHWLELARGEHASVAAFARFIAVLQRHGAPPGLLAQAIAAAADEVRHTELALALASRLAGRELELGPLAVDRALCDVDDLAEAVRAAVLEGCIGETLAAHEAGCLARTAEDPQVIETLERIAEDEARHAALAWRFVAWALDLQPGLRPIVAEALAVSRGSTNFALGDPEMADLETDPEMGDPERETLALGCPPARLRARWRELGRTELVDVCAARLLA